MPPYLTSNPKVMGAPNLKCGLVRKIKLKKAIDILFFS